MQEQLLQFIWHRQIFDRTNLLTTSGLEVEIIHPGYPNHDQGPDFLQSRIKIGEQTWAGHVEIHVLSSAWYQHMHERDTHYNNVILHVVWEEDVPVKTASGITLPCLVLNKRIDAGLLDRYRHLMQNEEWVPCASSLSKVDQMIRTAWLGRLMSERLEQRMMMIQRIHERCHQHYEQTFFVLLARYLGAPANSDAMENLGLQIPLQILRKHGDRIDQIEAILFGVAGMLSKDLHEDYPKQLKSEFDFLKNKYGLRTIPALQWKFMRMRPVHFPTIRIAQLATVISRTVHFIPLLKQFQTTEDWIRFFSVKPQHPYWHTHYHFRSSSPDSEKNLGGDTIASLVINLVAPFMFFYGRMQGHNDLADKAIRMLEELPAEKNHITRGWSGCGWNAVDAGQSQAQLHLKKEYCDQRRCLHCAVGLQILKM